MPFKLIEVEEPLNLEHAKYAKAYFKGVKPFITSNVEVGATFQFIHDFECKVLDKQWSLKEYCKSLLHGKFKLHNGYKFFYKFRVFPGISTISLSNISPEVVKVAMNRSMWGGPRVFIKADAKSDLYDFVISEVLFKNGSMSLGKIYRCKRIDKERPMIVKNMVLDVTCQKINAKSSEYL